MQTLSYRPDIDGLRAIAVVAIIIYHANSAWLPGGIASLGIFFVISGYLITSIIHREMAEHRFTFSQFYTRRIKRILPLFYSVIVATSAVSFWLFSPREFMEFGKTIRYAIFFLANVYFAREQDYFAPSAEEVPLLHLWTLSVEEQYYLVWPALLLVLLRKSPRLLLPACLLLGTASFALATVWALDTTHASLSYYSLPTRFGEFLVGSLVALHPLNLAGRRATLAAYTGMGLIIGSLIFVNDHVVYPGFNALWSCTGTALLIYAGATGLSTLPNRFLASRPMVFLGLISYSLYLWHWPLLAYSRYYTNTAALPLAWILSCLAATLAFSWLTWRFIEQPARLKKLSFAQAARLYFLMPTAVLLVLAGGIKATHGYLLRDRSEGLDTIESPSLVCHNDIGKNCQRGDLAKPVRTLIIGDSHGADMATFFDLLGQKQGWSADIMSVDSCPPLTNTNLSRITHRKQHDRCVKLVDYLRHNLDNYDNIVYSLRWELHLGYSSFPTYQPDPHFYEQLQAEISELTQTGKQVFLVSQPPLYRKNVDRLFRTSQGDNPVNPDYLAANQRIQALTGPQVRFIDTATVARHWPNGIANGLPAYKDENHLNIHGQKALLADPSFDWIGTAIQRRQSLSPGE